MGWLERGVLAAESRNAGAGVFWESWTKPGITDLNLCCAGPDLVIFTVLLQTLLQGGIIFILVPVELLNLSEREFIQVVSRVTPDVIYRGAV